LARGNCADDIAEMANGRSAVTWITLDGNLHESSYRTVKSYTVENEFGVSTSLETAIAQLTALGLWW